MFNIDALYLLSGRDGVRIRLLLEELLCSNRQDLRALVELREEDGPQAFAEIAHRIKGAARIVGAHELIQQCEKLEHASLANLATCRTGEMQHGLALNRHCSTNWSGCFGKPE